MQARRRLAALAMTIAGVLANGAHASDLRIARIGATSQGYPFVDYELEAPFTGKALDAIRSGLPSTLTFTFEVWRQRTGWWDDLEETREASVRVLRDLLNDQYIAASREEVRRFPQLDSLAQSVCAHRREYLRPREPKKSYYVVVSANLAPLSVEDLRELERWLSGSLRSGEESNPGRVAGFSGTMVGLLMSVTGFGDETTTSRSERFVPASLPRAPAPPAAPQTAGGGAVPDSARRREMEAQP